VLEPCLRCAGVTEQTRKAHGEAVSITARDCDPCASHLLEECLVEHSDERYSPSPR
jgi:hypothetical protein